LKTSILHIQEKFGAHLKQIREAKGLSLRGLSSRCDLDSSKISRMENGKTNLQLTSIFELAKGLGVEPKELLDFKI
jgi:transcriptional regulator with XRE-family HTH domain